LAVLCPATAGTPLFAHPAPTAPLYPGVPGHGRCPIAPLLRENVAALPPISTRHRRPVRSTRWWPANPNVFPIAANARRTRCFLRRHRTPPGRLALADHAYPTQEVWPLDPTDAWRRCQS